MKLLNSVVAAYMLATVAAFGDKGAAERAMWWADYLAEEGLDEADWKIGTNCQPGSRLGLLGQPARLTLAEFLRCIWTESEYNRQYKDPADGKIKTDGKMKDEEPNKEKSDKAFKNVGKDDLQNNNIDKITSKIEQYKEAGVLGATPGDFKPTNHFTGNLHVEKLYPHMNFGGLEPKYRFYMALESAGAVRKETENKLRAKIAALTNSDADKALKTKLNLCLKWNKQGQLGAKYDKELRFKDIAKYELAGGNAGNSLREKYGHDLVSIPHDPDPDVKSFSKLAKTIQKLGETETAIAAKAAFGGDELLAKTSLDEAKASFYLQPLAGDHLLAFQAAERNVVDSCATVPGA